MKKMFLPLAPLKKIRPKRKVLLALGYLLVVALLVAAVTWRGLLPISVDSLRGINSKAAEPGAGESVNTEQTDAPPVLDGESNAPGETPFVEQEEAVPVLTLPTEPMIWPLQGDVLAGHHDVYKIGNTLRAHVGVDLEAESGSAVQAAWPGIVSRVTQDPRLGWLIEIRHGGDYVTQYANLSNEPTLTVGDEVLLGDIIGQVGESAKLDATIGAHLHFAIYREDKALDPVQVISGR